MNREQREWVVVAVIGVVMFAVLGYLNNGPRGPWNYLVGILITMCIYAIFAMGLSLQFGHGGLLNFGHAAFMGVGAYAVALVTLHFGEPLASRMDGVSMLGLLTALLGALVAAAIVLLVALAIVERTMRHAAPRTRWILAGGAAGLAGLASFVGMFPFDASTAPNGVVVLGLVGGIALAGLASLILGIPAIRLREDYLAIVTLGAAEIFRSFVGNEEQWTRGTLGIIAVQRPVAQWATSTGWWQDLADLVMVRPIALAHAVLGVLLVAIVILVLQTLARSPWGRALKAIREDDAVAASLGKNVTLYKLQALMIGASIAAVAGVLYAWNVNSVFPEHYLPIVTFFAFIIVVMGGIGNHKGAILGAILLWGIFSLADSLTKFGFTLIEAGPKQNVLVGLVLVLIMMLRPHGAIGRKEELVLGK